MLYLLGVVFTHLDLLYANCSIFFLIREGSMDNNPYVN